MVRWPAVVREERPYVTAAIIVLAVLYLLELSQLRNFNFALAPFSFLFCTPPFPRQPGLLHLQKQFSIQFLLPEGRLDRLGTRWWRNRNGLYPGRFLKRLLGIGDISLLVN